MKAWFAGHKNIPSLVKEGGLYHFLSPQIVQAPCGFDIVDLYEKGMIRMYHEIEEQNYVWISRIQGKLTWEERSGLEKDRNVSLRYR